MFLYENKIFQCRFCPYQNKKKSKITRHMTVHSGAKPYLCHHCNKAYTRKDKLKCKVLSRQDIRKHLETMFLCENEIFQCRFCPYQNKNKYNITRHITVHSGEKFYLCHHCDKAYARKDGVKSHMLSRQRIRKRK